MARFGFVGRIGRALKKIVAPSPHPPRETPRQPPPRPEPPAPSRDTYKEIWREYKTGRAGSYRKNLKVFHSAIDPIEKDERERVELWESYVRHMVSPRGRYRRQDPQNMFWRDSGIDPDDWNWQAWREAMGYTGRRRSRTP
jgi:hypothetical protein